MELVVIAFMAVASVVSAVSMWRRVHRQATAAQIAAKAGLQFSPDDPFDCTRVAFPLFRRGDGRGADNVMWCTDAEGRARRVFDYWYYDEHRTENGGTSRTYHRYTSALVLTGGSWPGLSVRREGVLDRMADGLTGIDIDFESEEFNRLFTVTGPDRRFASTFIDPRMMEFLLGTEGEFSFELKGRWLLVWAKPIPAELMPGLLRLAGEFVDRIPKVVWDLYPSPFVDDEGEPLPAGDETMVLDRLLGDSRPDPYDVLAESPFEALHDETGPEYDLDGNIVEPKPENPWGDGLQPKAPSTPAPPSDSTTGPSTGR